MFLMPMVPQVGLNNVVVYFHLQYIWRSESYAAGTLSAGCHMRSQGAYYYGPQDEIICAWQGLDRD
jgi:hypothetical protein